MREYCLRKLPITIRFVKDLVFLIASFSFAIVVAAQSSPGPPSLSDTISFLNRSLTPDGGVVTSANHCEIEIVRGKRHMFGSPTSTYTKSTYQNGLKHYGFKWTMYQENYQVTRFYASNIDTQSIRSSAVSSPEFVTKNDLDENPKLLDNPDLYSVQFKTQDLKPLTYT